MSEEPSKPAPGRSTPETSAPGSTSGGSGGFDPLIARLTQRLEDDGELQREVARELHTHLDDAAGEYRAAGREEVEAAREAMAHLGAEEELAEQIWQANRRRLRTRAVVRWVARLTLLPAAIVTIMFVIAGEPGAQVQTFVGNASGRPWSDLGMLFRQRELTDEQSWLLRGDFAALHAAWPQDPEIFAVFFTQWFGQQTVSGVIAGKQEPRSGTREQLIEQALAMIASGERIEPNNAMYPAFEALVWFAQAGSLEETPTYTVEFSANGCRQEIEVHAMVVRNPQAMNHALAAMKRAAGKPYWNDHAADLAIRRLDIVGPPRSLTEMTAGVEFMACTQNPNHGQIWQLTRYVCGAAIWQTQQGDRKSAESTLATVKPSIRLLAEGSRTASELWAVETYAERVEAAHAAIAHVAGNDRKAELLRQRVEHDALSVRAMLQHHDARSVQMRHHAPAVMALLYSAPPADKLDPSPGRWAEQAMMLRLALVCLLLILTAITAWQGAVALWRARRSPSPTLMFIGWRRLATVWLVAIGGPVLLAIGYALLPLPTHKYGMHVVPGLRVLEMTLFVVTALVLLRTMAFRAVRARAVELGIDLPPARGWRGRILTAGGGILLLIAAVICIGHLQGVTNPERTTIIALPLSAILLLWLSVMGLDEATAVAAPQQRGPTVRGVIVLFSTATIASAILFGVGQRGVVFFPAIAASLGVGVVAGIVGMLYLRQTRERPYAWFAASFGRSLQPIFAGAIVLLGLLVGLPLQWGEMWAVRKLPYPLWFHAAELSGMKELQAQIVERMQEPRG